MKSIYFGRGICGELSTAESMEWLVTNGIGGYASGTIANILTRRYHGLLVAALKPPLKRTLLLSKLDDVVEYDGKSFPIYANRWAGILVEPHGYRNIERFHMEGTTPVWTFSFGSAHLEKRIFMQPGANTTYIFYRLRRAIYPLTLTARPMVNYRDFHGETHAGDWQMNVRRVPQGIRIAAFDEAIPFYILSDRAMILNQEHHWYRNFSLNMEANYGSAMEDHLNLGQFRVTLEPDETVTFVVSTEPTPNLDGEAALSERYDYEERITSLAPEMPPRLVLAANQFIVKRSDDNADGWSIIAGYPWLRDWSRDTLISLPGLLLTTGRINEAKNILETYSKYVSEGMLPNHLPEDGDEPEYISVDVTLWYFEAIRAYFAATGDLALLEKLFPILADIVHWFEQGTRFHIQVDAQDGLLYAGEPGIPLTWMDSKSGDWGITPRTGKPVEINALWYNALLSMVEFAAVLDKPGTHFKDLAKKNRKGFSRFWNEKLGCCYDVIDSPNGSDASLRPNQILAVSLQHSPLDAAKQKSILDVCIRRLLTPLGLRSLSPDEQGYVGHYNHDSHHRDSTYHQGTVWGWLIGPFVSAYLKVYKDPQTAQLYLDPFLDHLTSRGVGNISEIFDGDAPYTPRGCVAQAWSVAEILRVLKEIKQFQTHLAAQPQKIK